MSISITKKILLFCVIFLTAAILFHLFSKEENIFQDREEFAQSIYAKEIPSVNELVTLIPESAKNIQLIYKKNRIKNIMISFDYCNIEKKDYVNFLKNQLREYSAEIFIRKNQSIAIIFQPIKTASFLQIDIDVDDRHVIIQTY